MTLRCRFCRTPLVPETDIGGETIWRCVLPACGGCPCDRNPYFLKYLEKRGK